MPLSPIAGGHIATIVTALEMTQRPALRAMPSSELRLERWKEASLHKYRALYRRVGEPWLWFSRLVMDDAELTSIIHHDDVHIWAVVDKAGIELGILELDFRKPGECEIGFFGLVPELNGKGHGRWLMAMALQAAWGHKNVSRVWVHTCTLDHHSALSFYRRSGFIPYEQMIETFPDPRKIGIIDAQCAPQIPLL
jgi:GNAT superfamily N-acetyltransferase